MPLLGLGARLLRGYDWALARHPLATQVVTTGALW